MSADTHHDAVAVLVREVHRAWRAHDFDSLVRLFHPDIVIAGPGGVAYAQGAGACIESYRAFTSHAQIFAYHAAAPAVHVAGDTAVAAYAWRMTYRRDGNVSTESGSDQLVCTRVDGRWQVLYRLLTFDAQPAVLQGAAANEPSVSAV